MNTQTLSPALLYKLDAYWRATNYLSVGQLYLYDNPLLTVPLELTHVKPMIVGHWGTTPGQNFIYVHLNRVINQYDLNMLYIAGPGHGGPALVANTYLEGSYSEYYPAISQDVAGLQKLFKQFSFPGGISSHVAPTTPGSIHEGGELGYSLSHAFGAVFDNPELIAACVIGDGEAETAALATSWQSIHFLNPLTDGAVLPILHLNGYKISNPTLLARIKPEALTDYFHGCGWQPYWVNGCEPEQMHQAMATTLDKVIQDIKRIQTRVRTGEVDETLLWPMIILKSPKGWTGPTFIDNLPIEGSFRSHQVPLLVDAKHPTHVALLEAWLQSYQPEQLFDTKGHLKSELAELAPTGIRRMGCNPHTNGGLLRQDLTLPDYCLNAVLVPQPGRVSAQDCHVLGNYLRTVIQLNPHHFRLFGPDETLSNLLNGVFEVADRQWQASLLPSDQFLSPTGRIMDAMLSEHQCEGWLEGYLLTGRHGLFSCYEAFIRIVDSMVSQHAKWLKVCAELPWRRDIASLNILLTSHVWQQDHNGFTHQDPGFLDHVITKKASIVRAYLPPDANCLLAITDHCLRSRNYINVIIAGKHAMPQWLSIQAATTHCAEGIGRWSWASCAASLEPDIIMACCGDTPTLETLAAVSLLNTHLPTLNIRVINVVDLMRLQSASEHPHGLTDDAYEALFTKTHHTVFAFHGYASLIHQLTHQRRNRQLHVRGYCEEGTITTPFDLRVQNKIDRFHLVLTVLDHVLLLDSAAMALKQLMLNKLLQHQIYIAQHGTDLPEVLNWQWPARI